MKKLIWKILGKILDVSKPEVEQIKKTSTSTVKIVNKGNSNVKVFINKK